MEAAGLVTGAIALASLFTICLDLLDCFELGRNHAVSYQLACTQMGRLKARLSAWGASLNVEAPGYEHPALRSHWSEEQEVIGRSLFGIKEIFENASLLVDKYKLTPERSRSLQSLQFDAAKDISADSTASSVRGSTTVWALQRKRSTWAIHDRQKFDNFIQDLGFLIGELENAAERVRISQTRKKLPRTQSAVLPVPGGSSALLPRKDTGDTGRQPIQPEVKHLSKEDKKYESLNVKQLAEGMSGSVYFTNQEVRKGTAIMGNVGQSDKRHVYTGGQMIHGDGFGILGDVTPDAFVFLQLQHRDPRKKVHPPGHKIAPVA